MKLSLRVAAEKAPAHVALIDSDRALTFAQLDALVQPRRTPRSPRPTLWTAGSDLDSLLSLYAHLDSQQLIVPLRPADTAPPVDPAAGRSFDDDALAVPTSASTALHPKLAVLTHTALVAAAEASAARLGWHDQDRWLLCLPTHRIGGLSILLRCLWAARTVVLLPKFSAAAVATACDRHRVTLISLVPAMLREMLDRRPLWQPPATLRAVLLGGAAASTELLREARERGVPVLPTYGLTETAAQVATVAPGTPPDAIHGVGTPLRGYSLRLGADDRIEINSPSLFAGYLPSTIRRTSDDGYWTTDDIGRVDDAGRWHVLGRLDDLIVSGGEKLHPLAIESKLRDLPNVRDVLVFGVPDPKWGALVAAAFVGQPLDRRELRAALESRLQGAARPRRVIWVDALPTAGDGKPSRRKAATLFADGLQII
ncbi:MAG: AMP-binding protein [Acidobacteriota bacterium]